ncbi:neurofilament medium polypeptide [Salix suchowensis]|nr:neurofilament medium polypeptide [Salix suchowensis]
MGGCASVPKNLKNEGGSAPEPEPPTENNEANNEAVKVELEAVEKVEEENAEKIDDDKKSLGSLLDENEVKKETTSDQSKEEKVASEQNQEQEATEDPAAESEKYQIKNAEEKAAGEKKEEDH